jgi:hypothetical protein
MQLSYRGIKYESTNSAVPAIPGEVIGKYRGTAIRTMRCAVPATESTVILQYRGTLYAKH